MTSVNTLSTSQALNSVANGTLTQNTFLDRHQKKALARQLYKELKQMISRGGLSSNGSSESVHSLLLGQICRRMSEQSLAAADISERGYLLKKEIRRVVRRLLNSGSKQKRKRPKMESNKDSRLSSYA